MASGRQPGTGLLFLTIRVSLVRCACANRRPADHHPFWSLCAFPAPHTSGLGWFDPVWGRAPRLSGCTPARPVSRAALEHRCQGDGGF